MKPPMVAVAQVDENMRISWPECSLQARHRGLSAGTPGSTITRPGWISFTAVHVAQMHDAAARQRHRLTVVAGARAARRDRTRHGHSRLRRTSITSASFRGR